MTKQDYVLIRKSTEAQNEQAQRRNVEAELRSRQILIPSERWIEITSSRADVASDKEFQRLLSLVEQGRVRTIYVESQDRFGTADSTEFFYFVHRLRQNKTKLYDLNADIDLTKTDLTTGILTHVGAEKSLAERRDMARRSLRTRINHFLAHGSWTASGRIPYGYDKTNYKADGTILWTFHRTKSHAIGDVYTMQDEKLVRSMTDTKPPRKAKTDVLLLTPSIDQRDIDNVQHIFDLYANKGLSIRQIAKQMNDEKRERFQSTTWHYSTIRDILDNEHYLGFTKFGSQKTGRYVEFSEDGTIDTLEDIREKGFIAKRENNHVLKVENTHEPLITQDTWDKVTKRRSTEQRDNFTARNPEYYLKRIFRCGHCGGKMTGRCNIHPTTKEKTYQYVCLSYVRGEASGIDAEDRCGFHCIHHTDAEKLLLDKLDELGQSLQTEDKVTFAQTESILGDQKTEKLKALIVELQSMIATYRDWLDEEYGLDDAMHKLINAYCPWDESYIRSLWRKQEADLPISWDELRSEIRAIDKGAAEQAKTKAKETKEQLTKLTKAWALTDSEEQKKILKEEADSLDAQLKDWQEKSVPLSKRIHTLKTDVDAIEQEIRELRQTIPQMDLQARGQAFQKIFETVTLYWSKEYHAPTNYRRKTDRQGRYKYTLDTERIEWTFADSNLIGSNCA